MSAVLTAEEALKLVGEMFVYHMPFNRALGLELERYEKEFAQLAFNNLTDDGRQLGAKHSAWRRDRGRRWTLPPGWCALAVR